MRTEKALRQVQKVANHIEHLYQENQSLTAQLKKTQDFLNGALKAWKQEKLELLRRYDPDGAENFEMLSRSVDQQPRGFTCGKCRDTCAPGQGAICWNCEPPTPDKVDSMGWDRHNQHLSDILSRYGAILERHLRNHTAQDVAWEVRNFLQDLHQLKDMKTPGKVEYLGPIPKGLSAGILADLLRYHALLRNCVIVGWPEPVDRG